jgi:hypothetical protein
MTGKVTRPYFRVFVLLASAVLAMRWWNDLKFSSDPEVVSLVEQAKQDAKPLLTELDAYQTSHGYYPTSLDALHRRSIATDGFEYVMGGRVYKSLDCTARGNAAESWHEINGEYKQRKYAFLTECVRGYSDFVLQSRCIKDPSSSYSGERWLLVQFTSVTAEWSPKRCGTPGTVHSPTELDDPEIMRFGRTHPQLGST